MAVTNLGSRPYDLVLFGATGYTGAYTINHIAALFPSDLPWAIAGRSASKLETVAADIAKRFPGRAAPAIEVCTNDPEPLSNLASKTKVIITTVGPYSKYGEPVVRACAENGTGYIDCTGEVPWVKHMIEKYDRTAKDNGAIIVPQAGIESALSDLFVHTLASEVRNKYGLPTKDVTSLLWNLKSVPSGGTLATVFALFDAFSMSYIAKSMRPYSLSPVPRPSGTYPARGGLGRITGTKWVDKLGWAANSGPIMGVTNAAIVWRTWGLFQENADTVSESAARKTRSVAAKASNISYGSNFHYSELRAVKNRVAGTIAHLAVTLGPVLLLLPPIRWLIKRLVYQPGQGPTPESTKDDMVEFRAVATAETPNSEEKKQVTGKIAFKASMYDITGATLAAGARVLVNLYKEKAGQGVQDGADCYARREGGGLMTPACLGADYIVGLRERGLILEIDG